MRTAERPRRQALPVALCKRMQGRATVSACHSRATTSPPNNAPSADGCLPGEKCCSAVDPWLYMVNTSRLTVGTPPPGL